VANHPQVWLQDGSEERAIRVSPLSMDCPFCDAQLGSVVAARLMVGTPCDCGARVIRISATELAPTPPAVLAEAYREVRRRINDSVIGHDQAVAQLALMGARHLHLGGRQRALMIGPSGTGKTTIAVALADALGCPAVVWDASVSSEVGWSGVSVANILAEMYSAYDEDLRWMARGILIADEIDKLAVRDATGSAREHRLGQMKSLLGILGAGAPVRFQQDGDRGRPVSVTTDDMLIIGMGSFHDLPPHPGPAELIGYGFTIEFASRFPVVITLDSLDTDALVRLLRREMAPSIASAADFGFAIDVPDSVLIYVATAVGSGGDSVTPRAGVGWLQSAVDAALLRLIELEARQGTRYQIRPDEVSVPCGLRRP
jgi:ATP-dependent Clp protease ATP-binding subunit ClpX